MERFRRMSDVELILREGDGMRRHDNLAWDEGRLTLETSGGEEMICMRG